MVWDFSVQGLSINNVKFLGFLLRAYYDDILILILHDFLQPIRIGYLDQKSTERCATFRMSSLRRSVDLVNPSLPTVL